VITIEKTQDLWHLGDVNGLKFEAKVYEPSSFGIKNGSVVKLFVYKKDFKTGLYRCVVQYDRGWYKRGRPKEPRTVQAVRELLKMFDAQSQSGKRKEPDLQMISGNS
jgi:hypothetical protein